MVDLRTAVTLHGFADAEAPRPPLQYQELLAPGVVHVDYADPDHVFRVTVEQVERRRLTVPATAAAQLADITVRVSAVTADTHLSLHLEGTGAAADAVAAEHQRAFQSWENSYRPGTPMAAPPAWPADRLMREVRVHVSDDVGTNYRFASGEAGGHDNPWKALRRYLPAPPPDATALDLVLAVADRPDIHVTVPLTS
ncbi:hypothetical protein WDZ17_17065 [Pseudokineococcus basanitobsidens]|uniref:DUF2126 domain-containing protein n=1 Tax=Pseudokineococcus basanitobsidens TaxID=1926649 RepID=A0ABU8RPG7_9ACTN